jgi:hypothetical protein
MKDRTKAFEVLLQTIQAGARSPSDELMILRALISYVQAQEQEWISVYTKDRK